MLWPLACESRIASMAKRLSLAVPPLRLQRRLLVGGLVYAQDNPTESPGLGKIGDDQQRWVRVSGGNGPKTRVRIAAGRAIQFFCIGPEITPEACSRRHDKASSLAGRAKGVS